MHRDLKPGHVMPAADGPRVVDFGIARSFEEATSLTASAVTVYAVTGRPVFDAGSQRTPVKSVLVDEPDCSDRSGRLRGIAERCLSKAPEERPSARELIDLLTGTAATPVVAQAPVQAQPPARSPVRTQTAGRPPLWFDGDGCSPPRWPRPWRPRSRGRPEEPPKSL